MSLSFATAIVASLLRPDPDAEGKFAEVERRIQLGERGVDGTE
jgi:hypothetical protein